MDVTTLNIDPQLFWGIVGMGGFAVACVLVVGLMASGKGDQADPLEVMKANLGLKKTNAGLFLIAVVLWGAVFVLLTLGLVWLIWTMIWQGFPVGDEAVWNWRFGLAKLTALVATLGAVVALPVTLQRLRLTRQQNDLSAEALFNDKINAAAGDLHARRLVTNNPDNKDDRWDFWQDDIIKRNAAIDRLEGLVRENPETAERIARLLGIYVRELSAENKPQVAPEEASPDELQKWTRNLKDHRRTDMENAAQSLGRLRGIAGVKAPMVPIDLRGANLQGFDFRDLNFMGGQFWGAQLHGANLVRTQMRGARLILTKLQGAQLLGVQMQGVFFLRANLDAVTNFDSAFLKAAGFRFIDLADVAITQSQINSAFGDRSVDLPEDCTYPSHWPEESLDWDQFEEQWRAWQKKIGYNRNAPDG